MHSALQRASPCLKTADFRFSLSIRQMALHSNELPIISSSLFYDYAVFLLLYRLGIIHTDNNILRAMEIDSPPAPSTSVEEERESLPLTVHVRQPLSVPRRREIPVQEDFGKATYALSRHRKNKVPFPCFPSFLLIFYRYLFGKVRHFPEKFMSLCWQPDFAFPDCFRGSVSTAQF